MSDETPFRTTRSTAVTSPASQGENTREHLIVQTAFLGDLLLGIPFLKTFRRMFPHDRVVLLCRRGLGDMMLASRLVDEVVEVDKRADPKGPYGWKAAYQRLLWKNSPSRVRRVFETVLSPHESFRSGLLVRRVRARRKIGFRRFFNFLFFSTRVRRPSELPEALRQLALLQPMNEIWSSRLSEYAHDQGASGGRRVPTQIALGAGLTALTHVPEWAEMLLPELAHLRKDFHLLGGLAQAAASLVTRLECSRELFQKLQWRIGKTAFLAPGSVWPTKMWTADGFARVGQVLAQDGYRVILTGSALEKEICESIASQVPGAVSIAGETTIWALMELFALADLLVCNDSGSMHMAAAAGLPTVSVFGPTVLDFGYRPWQDQARVVEISKAEMPCRPCGKHGAKKCPIGTHACMTRVTPTMVLEKVADLSKHPSR